MSKKSISEALADIQRKVNEQRMKNAESNWNSINEAEPPASRAARQARQDAKEQEQPNKSFFKLGPTDFKQTTYSGTSSSPESRNSNPGAGFYRTGENDKAGEIEQPKNSLADRVAELRAKMLNTDPEAEKKSIAGTPGAVPVPKPDSATPPPAAAPKPAGSSGATMPSSVPGTGATASGFGISGPTSSAGAVSSAPKPAVKPAAPMPTRRPADSAPQAQSAPAPKPDYGYATPGSDSDTPSNFFAADAARMKAQGGKAANDFSSEEESGGKTKAKRPIKESALINAALGLIGQENMFEAAKKMKGTCSSCGKMPCQCSGDVKEELKGNQKKIDANHNGKVDSQDFKILRGKKKMEEEKKAKPDYLDMDKDGNKKESMKKAIKDKKIKDYRADRDKHGEMEEEVEFSEAEIARIASIMEADAPAKAPVDGNKNYKVNAKGNEVGTGPTAGDLSDETIIDEARGRPKGSSKADVNPNNEHGRDPRQHIQVIAGQAAAGRVMDFKHENGEVSKISPGMGRRIGAHLDSLKPAEKQAAVLKMHKHAEGLKV